MGIKKAFFFGESFQPARLLRHVSSFHGFFFRLKGSRVKWCPPFRDRFFLAPVSRVGRWWWEHVGGGVWMWLMLGKGCVTSIEWWKPIFFWILDFIWIYIYIHIYVVCIDIYSVLFWGHIIFDDFAHSYVTLFGSAYELLPWVGGQYGWQQPS